WQSARVKFTDLSTGHLAYPAASTSVAAGVMKAGSDNTFEPSRPVTGQEAIEAIDRVAALAGPLSAKGKRGNDGADAGEPAHAASHAADPGVRDPRRLRSAGMGARGLCARRADRRVRRTARAARRTEDEPRRVARPDGRQAAAGHDLRRADAARP